jgi:dUTP pyrophosphatase
MERSLKEFFLASPQSHLHLLHPKRYLSFQLFLCILFFSTTSSAMTSFSRRPQLLVKKLSEYAQLPQQGSAVAAGFDLFSAEDTILPAGQRGLVKTDLSIACPEGTYGRIAPRSGLALKHGIDVGAGVIDADYRGPVGILLFNLSDQDFAIKRGDRIAQLILEQIVIPEIQEVEDLSETTRGAGGFGSTGVSSTRDPPALSPMEMKKQRTISPQPPVDEKPN